MVVFIGLLDLPDSFWSSVMSVLYPPNVPEILLAFVRALCKLPATI